MMGKRSRLFTIVLFVLNLSVYAQHDWRDGFIIKNSGDTMQGSIDYRGDLYMSNSCRFKNQNDEITEFSPNDLIAYRISDSKYFISRELESGKFFLEYLINGKVNIYYLRDGKGDHYYLDKDSMPLNEISYDEGLRIVNDKQVHYKSTRHNGLLKYYMQDAPNFDSKINSVKEPSHQNLVKIAEDYHNVVCKDDKCIIYAKRPALFKLNIELLAGVVNYENINYLIDEYYFQKGFMAQIWMPRANEKLYFKVGFLHSYYNYNNERDVYSRNYYIRVPIQFGYMAPRTMRVRPNFSIGIFAPSYSGGVAVRLGERINVGVQSWVNFGFQDVPWVPNELQDYSFLGNVFIEI